MPLHRLTRLSTFKRGFASTFVLDVFARGLSAVTLVVLLRVLSVEDFAFVILLTNVGQFLGGAATNGLRLRYVRTQAERISRKLEERSSFYLTLRTGTLLILVAGIIGFLGAAALGVGTSGERATFAVIATGFTLGHATIELSVYHFQAETAFTKAGVIAALRSLVQLVLAGGAAVGLLTTGPAVGAAFAVGLCCLAAAVAGPVAWSTRRSVIDKEGRFGFGRESGLLTVYSLSSAGRAYSSIFLVAALLDDAALVAYGTAERYLSVFTGPVPALLSVLRVRTAQQDMVDSGEAQLGFMLRWAKRTALPMLVVFAAGAFAAPYAIPILDEGRYPLSVPVFQVMLVGAFAHLVTLPHTSLLMAQKRYDLLAWVHTAAVVVTVAGSVAVAGPLGPVGVAAVTTLVTFSQVSYLSYMAAHPPAPATAEAPHR